MWLGVLLGKTMLGVFFNSLEMAVESCSQIGPRREITGAGDQDLSPRYIPLNRN